MQRRFVSRKQWIHENKVSSLSAPYFLGCSLSKRGIPYQKHVTMEKHLKTRAFIHFHPVGPPLSLKFFTKVEPECGPMASRPRVLGPGRLLSVSSNTNLSLKLACCRLPGKPGSLSCSLGPWPQSETHSGCFLRLVYFVPSSPAFLSTNCELSLSPRRTVVPGT